MDTQQRIPAYGNESYTVGWICALSLEQVAAKLMLEKEHGRPEALHPRDHNVYRLGEISGHLIVIAALPKGDFGTNSANTVAQNILMSFPNVQLGLMVGIGGGIPTHETTDVRLGDVVVSCPTTVFGGVVQFSRGKSEQDGFKRTGMLNRPPQKLLTAASKLHGESRCKTLLTKTIQQTLAQDKHHNELLEMGWESFCYQGFENDILFKDDYPHQSKGDCKECIPEKQVQRSKRQNPNPFVHHGVIASGDWVVKNTQERERIKEDCGALCIEMEAAGLQHFPCLVVRGICDYADSHKNKRWQQYAALTAAAYAKELLYDIVPASPLTGVSSMEYVGLSGGRPAQSPWQPAWIPLEPVVLNSGRPGPQHHHSEPSPQRFQDPGPQQHHHSEPSPQRFPNHNPQHHHTDPNAQRYQSHSSPYPSPQKPHFSNGPNTTQNTTAPFDTRYTTSQNSSIISNNVRLMVQEPLTSNDNTYQPLLPRRPDLLSSYRHTAPPTSNPSQYQYQPLSTGYSYQPQNGFYESLSSFSEPPSSFATKRFNGAHPPVPELQLNSFLFQGERNGRVQGVFGGH